MDLKLEIIMAKDILFQIEQAKWDLEQGFKKGAHHRLKTAHDWGQSQQNYLADAIEETS